MFREMQAKKLDGNGENLCAVPVDSTELKSIAAICAVPMELRPWEATYNGLKSVATTWIAPTELQNSSCSKAKPIATVIMELNGIKRSGDRLSYFCQALWHDFGVRRSCAALFGCSLVLSCRGNPIPKRRRVAAVPKLLRNHKIQNSVLSHYLNLLSPFRLTNLLYVKREKSGARSQETEWEPENQKQLKMRNPGLLPEIKDWVNLLGIGFTIMVKGSSPGAPVV